MTIGVILVGLSAGKDVFAGGLAYGVAGLPRPRWTRTAAAFSTAGVLLLAAGLLLGEALNDAFGNAASYLAGAVADLSLGGLLLYVAVLGFVSTLAGLSLGKRLGARLGAAAHVLAGGVFVLLGAIIIFGAITGGKSY